jgi:Fe-coproporphyrin III synthase
MQSRPVLKVHPTRRCNLTCLHCHSSSGPSARQALDPALLAACVEDAVELGYRHLHVSGGEPLMYPALGALLAGARRSGMRTTVTTNGTLATVEHWAPLAPLVDVAVVSIDGTPSEHDALRCGNGAFVAAVRNLEVIRASGVSLELSFTLTQHNVDSLDFVVHLAAQHGARAVHVQPLALHGRAATELSGARPDDVELGFALFEASRLARELGVVVSVDALAAEQLVVHRAALVPPRTLTTLAALAPVLVVEADATVLPLTYEINPRLALGTLGSERGPARRRLTALADDWIAAGRGQTLADACARTWSELTEHPMPHAVSWYKEVALRTWPAIVTLRLRDIDRSVRQQLS